MLPKRIFQPAKVWAGGIGKGAETRRSTLAKQWDTSEGIRQQETLLSSSPAFAEAGRRGSIMHALPLAFPLSRCFWGLRKEDTVWSWWICLFATAFVVPAGYLEAFLTLTFPDMYKYYSFTACCLCATLTFPGWLFPDRASFRACPFERQAIWAAVPIIVWQTCIALQIPLFTMLVAVFS